MATLTKSWSSSRSTAALVLIVALAALLLAGCGGSSGSSSSSSQSTAPPSGTTPSSGTSAAATHTGSRASRSAPAHGATRDHARAAAPEPKGSSRTFLAHAGVAFGIFERDVYKPFKAGKLSDPSHHRVMISRARAATLLALSEVVQAKQAAGTTTALRKLFIPLGGLEVTLSTLATQFKHGHLDRFDIRSANSTIAAVNAAGSLSGLRIIERTQP
jgi:hypothetical protein